MSRWSTRPGACSIRSRVVEAIADSDLLLKGLTLVPPPPRKDHAPRTMAWRRSSAGLFGALRLRASHLALAWNARSSRPVGRLPRIERAGPRPTATMTTQHEPGSMYDAISHWTRCSGCAGPRNPHPPSYTEMSEARPSAGSRRHGRLISPTSAWSGRHMACRHAARNRHSGPDRLGLTGVRIHQRGRPAVCRCAPSTTSDPLRIRACRFGSPGPASPKKIARMPGAHGHAPGR